MRCISSARFNMTATVLRQGEYGDENVEQSGYWTERQDPITLEIIRVWVPTDTDPGTAGIQAATFKCIARGIVDGGIRVAGTTERITPQGIIDSADYVQLQFPTSVEISKRDRVYNIKGSNGLLVWKEEEFNGAATIFEVLGVTPILDPFGRHMENHALLKRAEVQSDGQEN